MSVSELVEALRLLVIPAKAGTQNAWRAISELWVPAFAGMTKKGNMRYYIKYIGIYHGVVI
jgi:hypothetical protein